MKRPDFKTKRTEYIIIQIRVCYVVLSCHTLLFKTEHDNGEKHCMHRKNLAQREKECGAAAAKLTRSLQKSELRCFGFVEFAFVCFAHSHS